MRTPTSVLVDYNLTREEQVAILESFTPDQLALLHTYYGQVVMLRSQLQYDPESPMAQVKAAAYYDGKLELLKLFLNPEFLL